MWLADSPFSFYSGQCKHDSFACDQPCKSSVWWMLYSASSFAWNLGPQKSSGSSDLSRQGIGCCTEGHMFNSYNWGIQLLKILRCAHAIVVDVSIIYRDKCWVEETPSIVNYQRKMAFQLPYNLCPAGTDWRLASKESWFEHHSLLGHRHPWFWTKCLDYVSASCLSLISSYSCLASSSKSFLYLSHLKKVMCAFDISSAGGSILA